MYKLFQYSGAVQKGYERGLLALYVWFHISGVDLLPVPDRVVCRDEILSGEIFAPFVSFGPGCPTFKKYAAAHELCAECYPLHGGDPPAGLYIFNDMLPCRLSVKMLEIFLDFHDNCKKR